MLYKNGYKISKIAILTEHKLIKEVSELIDKKNSKSLPIEINTLLTFSLSLDTNGVNNTLEDLYKKYGMISMYQNYIKVFLIRIGELWQLNTFQISHEHLFSNCLRNFLNNKISQIKKDQINKTALLFLPEKEEHEISLLFYKYLLVDKGWNCIYLGQKVPLKDFEAAYLQTSPDIVITSLIKSNSSKQFKNIVNKIVEIVPGQRIYLSGSNTIVYSKEIPKGISTIHSLTDFTKIFE